MIIIYTLKQYTILGLRSRNTANLVNISKQSNATAVTTATTTIASVTTASGSNTNTSNYNQRSFSDYFNTWIHSSSSGSSSSLEVLTTTLLVSQEPSSFPGLQKTITTLQKMTPRDRIILGMYC